MCARFRKVPRDRVRRPTLCGGNTSAALSLAKQLCVLSPLESMRGPCWFGAALGGMLCLLGCVFGVRQIFELRVIQALLLVKKNDEGNYDVITTSQV
jgi:hypothetical protein